jgi:uncharacterized protein (UPF0332 family)
MTPRIYIEKAERALSTACTLLKAADTQCACNNIYFAMSDAARAALLAINYCDANAKTHSELIRAFGRHVLKDGKIDVKYGRSFNQVQRMCNLVDHTGDSASVEDADWALSQADAFVAAIKAKFFTG